MTCQGCDGNCACQREGTLDMIRSIVLSRAPEHKRRTLGVYAYVAGPMRGIPEFNFPAFDAARDELVKAGWAVISPADEDRARGDEPTEDGEGAKHLSYYMETDLAAVAKVHAVFLLPGWEESRGATLEYFVARALDVPCYEWDTLEPPPIPELSVNVPEGREDVVFIPIDEYESEQRVVDSGTGGQKGQKLARFDLVPADALQALARHYGIGALKYEDDNWLRGYDWKLSLGAAGRHLNAFHRGESTYVERFVGHDGVEYEVETHHLIALAWQAFTLWVFDQYGLGNDTRRQCG